MEETVIVIMIKEKQTGFLEKELASCAVKENDELLLNAYAVKDDDISIHLKVTCPSDVLDWEFNAIFDYYDTDIYNEYSVSCKEASDCFNPTWELSFPYDEEVLEETVNKLLKIHKAELLDVYDIIKDKSGEYGVATD